MQMFGFIHSDSRLGRALNTIADIMALSVLWLVCSLPIVTIGTSTTALYCASMRSVLQQGSVFRDFFRAFKQNFKQGLCLTLLAFLIILLLTADFWLLSKVQIPGEVLLRIVLYIIVFLVVTVMSYVFPLVARFSCTIKKHLKNALLLGVSCPLTTVMLVVVNLAPYLFLMLKPGWFFRVLPLFTLIWTGAAAYLNSWLLLKLFQRIQRKSDGK